MSAISVQKRLLSAIDVQIRGGLACTAFYGISPAESRAVAKSAEGYTLAQIAQLFFLSIETVRTHVKHALVKFDCPSQSALIREILLGPAVALRAGSFRKHNVRHTELSLRWGVTFRGCRYSLMFRLPRSPGPQIAPTGRSSRLRKQPGRLHHATSWLVTRPSPWYRFASNTSN